MEFDTKLAAGHKKSKACGIMRHASRSRNGYQDRHSIGQEGEGRCHGVSAGRTFTSATAIALSTFALSTFALSTFALSTFALKLNPS